MAKKSIKTASRTGKSLVKKALVIRKTVVQQPVKKMEDLVQVDKAKKDKAKEDKKYNLTVGIRELFDAGCHLGHKIAKTHPKAKKNIYLSKDGIEIFDLVKTLDALDKAANYIYNAKRNGKQVVLVGTKRQAREVVRRVAIDAGIPYVTDRWLGGTISNWEQIKKNVKKLKDLKEGIEKNKFAEASKKELSEIRKEIVKLEGMVGGLVLCDKLFDIIFVVDTGIEKTAIKEANMRNIRTIGIVDSDSNPDKIDLPIPANDDNVKSVSLLVEEIGRAVKSAGVK